MLTDKLKAAIEIALIDNILSEKESERIYGIAKEEGTPITELEEYLNNLRRKCPNCFTVINNKAMRCEHCKYIFNSWYRKLFHWAELATPVIHIIGIVAIVLALWEFFEVAHLAKQTNDLAKKTDTVLTQMKTTHLEDFPENIPFLIEIIQNSRESLDIVTDFPAYGIFSKPEESKKYQDAIVSKLSNPSFRFSLIVFKEEVRKEKFMQQFKFKNLDPDKESDFQEFLNSKNNDSFKKKFNYWKEYCQSPLLKSHVTMNKLYESINDNHIIFLKKIEALKEGAVHLVSCELTSYFWISDNRQIAFSFVSLGKLVNECTFKSSDLDLLNTMGRTIQNLRTEE